MRVAVLGAGGAHKTEASIVRAARAAGHRCRLVNVVGWSRYAGPAAGSAVRYLVEALDPDFLLVTRHAMLAGEPTLRALFRNRQAAFWYFDLQPKPDVLTLARVVGRMYVTYLRQIDTYRAAGIEEVRFLPQGVDPAIDYPARTTRPEYLCDVSFVGSGQSAYRHSLLRAVARACSLQIRGSGWGRDASDLPVAGGPVRGDRLRQVIRGASISLGASSHSEQDADRASASNRMWRILGSGGFYLGPYVQDIEHFALGGRDCAWYRSAAHAVELIHHYLAAPDERRRIADQGRAHALRHHTYAHRLALLLAGREYVLDQAPSDDGVVSKLEHPHAGQPLDHL
jgi:Glycosyl transferases group 1/DUF based on E. rectale Gene description (DUF3880)